MHKENRYMNPFSLPATPPFNPARPPVFRSQILGLGSPFAVVKTIINDKCQTEMDGGKRRELTDATR